MRRITLILFVLFLLALSAPAQTATPQTEPDSGAMEALLTKAIKQGDTAQVSKLLDAGVNPDAVDEGAPVLIWAVRANHADIAVLLLDRKAKVDKEDECRGTALQTAAAAGQAELVKLLIKHHADVNHKDEDGHKPLLFAALGAAWVAAPERIANEVFETEDIKFVIGKEHTKVATLLLDAGADVNSQAGDCGLTPLMVAAMIGDVEFARILLDHHADVNLSNGEWTALQFTELFDSPDTRKEAAAERSEKALSDFCEITRYGRQVVAAMLRQAGAKRTTPNDSSAPPS